MHSKFSRVPFLHWKVSFDIVIDVMQIKCSQFYLLYIIQVVSICYKKIVIIKYKVHWEVSIVFFTYYLYT